MNKEIIKLWDLSKDNLRKRLSETDQSEHIDYENLLKMILQEMNNVEDYKQKFAVDKITRIDYGDWQGTLIFVFPEETYQPCSDETYYTTVWYGSCSGCDTLESIRDMYTTDKPLPWTGVPSNKQLDEYMMLCLHMVQRIRCMKGEDEL